MDNNRRVWLAGIMVFPILVWAGVIVGYAVNIPWFDDFDPFPDFLRHWIESNGSATERFKLIVQPNNEHRMVFGKLLVLGYYLVTGHLNFTFLQIGGALFTLGTCFLFWRSFRSAGIRWGYFMPVPFLLFQMQYHMTFLWSICSLQHQPVVFFVCLSMFFLSKEKFIWALVSAICATFAMSSGIFVWVAGAAVLLLRSQFRQLTFWCLVGALSIGLYFYGMSAQGNESSFGFLVKNPHLSVLGFLAFLGGLFDLFPWLRIEIRSILPVVTSLGVLTWVFGWLLSQFILFGKKYWQIPVPGYVSRFTSEHRDGTRLSVFALGVIIFLLANALAICILRPRFGFFVMLVSNYKIYPALFLSAAYLAYLSVTIGRSEQATRFRQVLIVSVLIWGFSMFNYFPTISERRKDLVVNAYNQKYNAFGLGHIPFSAGAKYVDDLMNGLVDKGVYSYPVETSFLVSEIKRAPVSSIEKMGLTLHLRNGQVEIGDPSAHFSYGMLNGNYAFLTNEKKSYVFKMNQNGYTGRNVFRQYADGASVVIPLSTLLPGTYKIGVIKYRNDGVVSGIVHSADVP